MIKISCHHLILSYLHQRAPSASFNVHQRMLMWSIVLLVLLAAVAAQSTSSRRPRPHHQFYDAVVNNSNVPIDELHALNDLYDSTNGDSWLWRPDGAGTRWNFTNPSANPCADKWQGINCTYLPPYQHISSIRLDTYNLTGTLPSSISNLTHLEALRLPHNSISGTLPMTFSQLTSLRSLDLMFNSINGSLSSTLGNLTQIENFVVLHNKLTGPIPESIGKWRNVTEIVLGGNKLTGSIPTALCSLTTLVQFDAFENGLSGHVPGCIGNLSRLEGLNLFHNRLTGTVPDLSGLTSLISLTFGLNLLEGALPASLSTLPRLVYLDLFDNEFAGRIPDSCGQMPQLEVLYLNHNHLTGPIDTLCGDHALQQLYLGDNRFSGTVPACLGDARAMENLYINFNHLVGSLPDTLSQLQGLIYFEANNNMLSGTLPASFGLLTNLTFLYLYENQFSGPLPASFAQLTSLKFLFIENNHFSGSLDAAFNASTQKMLHSIQLSGNAFTGDIPEQPFLAPVFTSFIAVDNCMHGSLPAAICAAQSLQVLVLDGMGTAKACRDQILPAISDSYLVTHPISGGVPACLFQMPNLTTLHLSGNGLTGTLPADLQLGDQLVDLALSHNVLTGSLPTAIQERVWFQLDLSYNRLGGSLLPSFSTRTAEHSFVKDQGVLKRTGGVNATELLLSLQNNRLSGRLPGAVKPLTDISILEGNLFACNFEQTDLPEHDSAVDSYTCGSNQFNAQIYAWLLMYFLLFACVFVVWRWEAVVDRYVRVADFAHKLRTWWVILDFPEVSKMRNFTYALGVADAVGKVTVLVTVVILVVCVPLYVLCSTYYGTVAHQYAWSVSFIFQSGVVPFALTFVAYVLIVVFALLLLQMYKQSLQSVLWRDVHDRQSHHAFVANAAPARIYLAYVSFFAINFAFVLGVNIAFVYITLYQSNELVLLAQWMLSLFKDFWNSIGALYLMRWCFHTVASNETSGADFINTQLFVALFNNIAIPCLVVAAVSPDCFYNLFVLAPTIHVHYVYLQCGVFAGDTCLFYLPSLATTSYTPPFTYSYQCGAQYILAYAPTFVYLAIEVAFLMPAAQWMTVMLHKRATPGTQWHRFLDYWMFNNTRLVTRTSVDRHSESSEASGHEVHSGSGAHPVHRDPFEPYFDVTQLLVQLMTYLGIVLTFGVVFPPLAVVMMAAIVSLIVTNKLVMGRFITNALEQKLPQYLDAIELDSQHLSDLHTSAWMLVWFACWFYALFLFDTLGNETGLYGAVWVFVVVPLIPPALMLLHSVYERVTQARGKRNESVTTGMEMKQENVVENPLSAEGRIVP